MAQREPEPPRRRNSPVGRMLDAYHVGPVNSSPTTYAFDLAGYVFPKPAHSRSDIVIDALIGADDRIKRGRGFHRAVFDAIFDDAFDCAYGDLPKQSAFHARVVRRWGRRRARVLFGRRIDVLASWHECTFIPDAYLIDSVWGVVVCYEIEDTNRLSHAAVRGYGYAWWNFDEIGWDLHLISYDIYGNPRIVAFPESDISARLYDDHQYKAQLSRRRWREEKVQGDE